MKKFKVVLWYPPKKKFVTLEKNLNNKQAMYRAIFFKNRELNAVVMRSNIKKIRKVM